MLISTAWNVGYSQENRNDTLRICENYIRLSAFYKTKAVNFENKFNSEVKKNEYLLLQNDLYEDKFIKQNELHTIVERSLRAQIKQEQKKSKHRFWSGLKTGGIISVSIIGLIAILN